MSIYSLGCVFKYLVKFLIIKGTISEMEMADKHCPPFLGIPMTWNHLVGVGLLGMCKSEESLFSRYITPEGFYMFSAFLRKRSDFAYTC